LPMDEIERLSAESGAGAPDAIFTVDLQAEEVITPSTRRVPFSIPAFRRQALMEGLDEISQNVAKDGAISAHLNAAKQARPWMFPAGQDS
jgi:3-isopropylmalate/(R)-2-methylmalate dehydratase small subunit